MTEPEVPEYDRPVESLLDVVVYFKGPVDDATAEEVAGLFSEVFRRAEQGETVYYTIDGTRTVVIHVNRDAVTFEHLQEFQQKLPEEVEVHIGIGHVEAINNQIG